MHRIIQIKLLLQGIYYESPLYTSTIFEHLSINEKHNTITVFWNSIKFKLNHLLAPFVESLVGAKTC